MRPFLYMMEYHGKVLGNDLVARATRKLVVQVEGAFSYRPGQFVVLRIPGQANPLLGRSYSIASRAGEASLEFLVRIVEGGVGSQYIDALALGDEVVFTGPFGKFVLKEGDVRRDTLFVATGTGVGPFIPMIDALIARGGTEVITLLMGYREKADMLVQTKAQVWHEVYPHFEAITCLSREGGAWDGPRGRVTDYLRNNPSLMAGRQVYICGNGGMVDEVRMIAAEHGVAQEDIIFERYNNI